MKLIVSPVPIGINTTDSVKVFILHSPDGVTINSTDESIAVYTELDFSRLQVFHYQLGKIIKQDRGRGVLLKLLSESDRLGADIIWGAENLLEVYQEVTEILESRLSSRRKPPSNRAAAS